MKKNYPFMLQVFTFLMMALLFTTEAKAQLYINEFMASNDMAFPGPQGDHPDWIEIYNAGDEAVMLGGYYLSDDLTDPTKMFQISSEFPDSVTISAGGYLLFFANSDPDWSVLNLNFKLGGGGEAIGFWNPDQVFVDSLTYGEQIADVSFGRYEDGTNNWYAMTNYTPGAANQNPAPAPIMLYINEFMASNDVAFPGPQGDYPDWIEIYNAGTEDVMLGGYYLSDDLADPAKMFQIPATYPDSVTVPAGGYLVFYANSDPDWSVLNLNFKLGGSGEQIGLWNPGQVFVDSLTYGEQMADTSYGRYQDGSNNWFFMPDFTPGASNTNPNPPSPTSLYINEFMASNDGAVPGPQGDYPDWIEIYNAGSEAVMLGGYYMSDDLNDPEKMFQIPSTYPDSVTVQAGGFIVFYANSDPDWSVLNLNFKLSGGGEHIGLWNPDQVFVDSLTYGEQYADTTYGRFTDGTNNWYLMPDYSPGEPNRYTDAISEFRDVNSFSISYPNPFENETKIEFVLDKTEPVSIMIFDITGAVIEKVENKLFQKGLQQYRWDATGLPSGYYFYQIKTSGNNVTGKVCKIR
jgi:hypothetical protein